jgi:hypothetical protein
MPIPTLSNKLANQMMELASNAVKNGSPSEEEYLKLSSEAFNLSTKQKKVISLFLENWKGITCE